MRRLPLPLRRGLALAGLYLTVLAATVVWAGTPLRPLFDGLAPPPPYRWVDPPKGFADNQRPAAVRSEIPLDPALGSLQVDTATSDYQATVTLKRGSVPPKPPDTAVLVDIRPLDPATLGPFPDGLRPISNAYRVELTYRPSGDPVPPLPVPGLVALTAATEGRGLLRSEDGRTWEPLASRAYGADHGQFSQLVSGGYFVVVAPVTEEDPGATTAGGSTTFLVIVLILVPVVGGVLLLRGRGRPRPAERRS